MRLREFLESRPEIQQKAILALSHKPQEDWTPAENLADEIGTYRRQIHRHMSLIRYSLRNQTNWRLESHPRYGYRLKLQIQQ